MLICLAIIPKIIPMITFLLSNIIKIMRLAAISIAFLLIFPGISFAKTPIGIRYKHEIFSDVDITKDVVYGSNYQDGKPIELKMDVYEPHGDTASKRALIIFIHGGGFTGGDKAGKPWVALCTTFAKRGYVAASINYRLQSHLQNESDVKKAITEAMHDAKAAVRYFRRYAQQWRIDESRIAIAGGSAGAITALHVTYLREKEYEGNSGNAGYSSNVSACIDLWGGLYDNVTQIDEGEPPVCIIHGTLDEVVPYKEALNISQRCKQVGVYYELHPLEGEGHGPWHLIKKFLPWMVNFLYSKMIKSKEVRKTPFLDLPWIVFLLIIKAATSNYFRF